MKIKPIFQFGISMILLFFLSSCGTKDLAENEFLDERDGQVYQWVKMSDGNKWMAKDLNYSTSDSWVFDNKKSNATKYGRLYTYESAMKACPNGWRLPTESEWWDMIDSYGGAMNTCPGRPIDFENKAGREAAGNLVDEGLTNFNATFGGYRNPEAEFDYKNTYGFYWTSSPRGNNQSYTFRFDKRGRNDDLVVRAFQGNDYALSCRCIEDNLYTSN